MYTGGSGGLAPHILNLDTSCRPVPRIISEQQIGTDQLKCDGTRAETRFRLSAKRTSPFKSAGASVQSTTGSRGVRISCSNAGYTMFRGSVKGTGYPLNSPFPLHFPSRASPCAIIFQLESKSLMRQGLTVWSIAQVYVPQGVAKTNQIIRHDSGSLTQI